MLVGLGLEAPSDDPEQAAAWRDGVRQIVSSLRTQGPENQRSEAIAAKILDFRRKFVGDETKVLNLGDTKL